MAAPAPIGLKAAFRESLRIKSGLVGFGIILSLVGVAVIVPVYASYDVVRRWSQLDPWLDNPRLAAPEWTTWFTGKNEPRTTIFDDASFRQVVVHVPLPNSTLSLTIINYTKSFYWNYDNFPSEMALEINASYPGTSPLLKISWTRPDGQIIQLASRAVTSAERSRPVFYPFLPYSDNLDDRGKEIALNIRGWLLAEGVLPAQQVTSTPASPQYVLFAKNDSAQLSGKNANLLKGGYELGIRYIAITNQTEEQQVAVSGRFVLYGTVYGLAGTDYKRRDLMIGLLWGAPVALSFGVAAALVTVLVQMILGALGAWYGGALDVFIQRLADFYLIIPLLPLLILIALLYRPSIVIILFVLVIFGIAGGTTKVARSIVLQIREEQYIEAAQSYGASRMRILFRYIFPRLMPYTFALVALSVPVFIFLEASLSFLGLGDPILPTWGSLLGEAETNNAGFYGWWWWIAFPAGGIIYATVGFALLGYAFDKVLNPRLREE